MHADILELIPLPLSASIFLRMKWSEAPVLVEYTLTLPQCFELPDWFLEELTAAAAGCYIGNTSGSSTNHI